MSSRFVAISGRVREARALCCLSAASWIAGLVLAIATCKVASELCESAFGQVPQTLNGPPVQVQPYVPEPGAPVIVINPGTANPFPIGDGTGGGGGGDRTGSGDGTGTAGDGTGGGGDGTGDGGSASGNVGSSTALATMLGTAWGATAVANAQTVGVNPSALAATCVLESGCQNVGGGAVPKAFSKCIPPLSTRAYKRRLRPILR